MDEIRAKELIPAKALGCLDTEENENFLKLMEEDSEFPWQEFGQYQNLVAQMPTLLKFEAPDPEVKNKVINSIQAQAQAQAEEVQVEEEVVTEDTQDLSESVQDLNHTVEVIEDEGLIIEEEEIIPPELEDEIELDDKKPAVSSGISIKEPEKPAFDLTDLRNAKSKLTKEQKQKAQKKEVEKKVHDRTSKYFVSKFQKKEKVGGIVSNKLLVVAAIVIVIILVFLLIMYLGLSSEIDDNKQEIQKLKQRIGIALIQNESTPLESTIV